ncbi:MAG: transposase [Candidatus Scalindua sp.]|nr:transposase [Candidatus Scalindua sp.]
MFIPIKQTWNNIQTRVLRALSALINDWKAFGLPRFLQLDNEASFREACIILRPLVNYLDSALNFGIDIVFIPFKEPWRNGYIENFNKRFNELLWQSKRFKDLKELRVESKKFEINITTIRKYKKDNFSQQYCKGYTRR